MIEVGCRNQHKSSTQEILLSLHQCNFTLVYPVLQDLYMAVYQTEGWARNESQTRLVVPGLPYLRARQRRNTLARRTRSNKLSVSYFFSSSPRKLGISVPTPESSTIAKNWTQVFLGCCTRQQWSRSSALPTCFVSLGCTGGILIPLEKTATWSQGRETKLSLSYRNSHSENECKTNRVLG